MVLKREAPSGGNGGGGSTASDVRATGPYYGHSHQSTSISIQDLTDAIMSVLYPSGPAYNDAVLTDLRNAKPKIVIPDAPPNRQVGSPEPPPGTEADLRHVAGSGADTVTSGGGSAPNAPQPAPTQEQSPAPESEPFVPEYTYEVTENENYSRRLNEFIKRVNAATTAEEVQSIYQSAGWASDSSVAGRAVDDAMHRVETFEPEYQQWIQEQQELANQPGANTAAWEVDGRQILLPEGVTPLRGTAVPTVETAGGGGGGNNQADSDAPSSPAADEGPVGDAPTAAEQTEIERVQKELEDLMAEVPGAQNSAETVLGQLRDLLMRTQDPLARADIEQMIGDYERDLAEGGGNETVEDAVPETPGEAAAGGGGETAAEGEGEENTDPSVTVGVGIPGEDEADGQATGVDGAPADAPTDVPVDPQSPLDIPIDIPGDGEIPADGSDQGGGVENGEGSGVDGGVGTGTGGGVGDEEGPGVDEDPYDSDVPNPLLAPVINMPTQLPPTQTFTGYFGFGRGLVEEQRIRNPWTYRRK